MDEKDREKIKTTTQHKETHFHRSFSSSILLFCVLLMFIIFQKKIQNKKQTILVDACMAQRNKQQAKRGNPKQTHIVDEKTRNTQKSVSNFQKFTSISRNYGLLCILLLSIRCIFFLSSFVYVVALFIFNAFVFVCLFITIVIVDVVVAVVLFASFCLASAVLLHFELVSVHFSISLPLGQTISKP